MEYHILFTRELIWTTPTNAMFGINRSRIWYARGSFGVGARKSPPLRALEFIDYALHFWGFSHFFQGFSDSELDSMHQQFPVCSNSSNDSPAYTNTECTSIRIRTHTLGTFRNRFVIVSSLEIRNWLFSPIRTSLCNPGSNWQVQWHKPIGNKIHFMVYNCRYFAGKLLVLVAIYNLFEEFSADLLHVYLSLPRGCFCA